MIGSLKIKNIIDLVLTGLLLSFSVVGLFANFYYSALRFVYAVFGAGVLITFTFFKIFKRTIYSKILNLTSSIFYLLMTIGLLVELSLENNDIILIILVVTFAFLKTISGILDLIIFKNKYKQEEKIKRLIALSIFLPLFLFFFFFDIYFFSRAFFYTSISDNFSAFLFQVLALFIFLPIAIVLLIITIILEFISLKKYKKRGLPILLFTLIVCSLIIPLSLVTSRIIAREYSYFTVEKWKEAECPQRKYLMISFLKQHNVIGWDNEELVEYIDQPTMVENLSNLECAYLYKVEEIEYSDNRCQIEYICFDFSEELKIIKVHNDFRNEPKT